MQQVFYQLIESETRTVMLANAQPKYVFKTVVLLRKEASPRAV
jgi:hypothetical protein